MASEANFLDEELYRYILSASLRDDPLLARLRVETARLSESRMQVAPDLGQLLALLVRVVGARRAIEVGTFTGYSSLCIARALPDDGRLLCCDVNEEWTALAQRFWREDGVAPKIELVLAPAAQTLAARIEAGERGAYDFAFVDADKESYDRYYELCLELLRAGGLLVFDNVLWSGDVMDERSDDPQTRALAALNRKLHRDERVDISLIPIADGLYLARKRS